MEGFNMDDGMVDAFAAHYVQLRAELDELYVRWCNLCDKSTDGQIHDDQLIAHIMAIEREIDELDIVSE
jgi:hypothetical protein